MTAARQRLGAWGEAEAARYLEGRGCEIVARNWRTVGGELDLIVRQGEVLVFVEVKTRRSTAFGLPEAGVSWRKRQHLLLAARTYLAQEQPDFRGDWRIDVIALLLGPDGVEIAYFENAVGADD
jgi:putative endonuclease